MLELGRRVTRVPLDGDAIAVDLHESPGRHGPFSGEIAVVNWEALVDDERPVAIVIEEAVARVSNGETIETIPGDPLYPIKRTIRPRRAPE